MLGNRSDVRSSNLQVHRSTLSGIGDGPTPDASATGVAVPDVPDVVAVAGRVLTVEGAAYYDPDDGVVIAVYTVASCLGPERLVGVAPEAGGHYEAAALLPEDARGVLVQAVPTTGPRGSSEYSACVVIPPESLPAPQGQVPRSSGWGSTRPFGIGTHVPRAPPVLEHLTMPMIGA